MSGPVHTKKKKSRTGKLLLILLILMAAVALIHLVEGLTLGRTLAYTELSYTSPLIGPELDGYTIAFVTDTHAITDGDAAAVAERISRRGVDVLLLGGDFAPGQGAWNTVAQLARAETRDGIYGVEGNHDNYRDLFAAYETHGVVPLSNSGLHLRPGLYLAGTADLWNRTPDLAQAVQDAQPGDFVLAVSHNPDLAMQQDGLAHLVLSGHTHGGQITLFRVFAPSLVLTDHVTEYGQTFMGGFAETPGGTAVLVSRGTGPSDRMPRIFSRRQVIFLTLRAGDA